MKILYNLDIWASFGLCTFLYIRSNVLNIVDKMKLKIMKSDKIQCDFNNSKASN